MSSVDIKVDVPGQIRLFRSATFPSKYPFIEESIQNSQRSKATEIDFWVSSKRVVVTDDGIGLSDPSDLFTIAHSGWDEETKANQNPFGIGFFSCVKMANEIVIESNKFRIYFDVRRVIEEGLTKLNVVEIEPVKGFRVILSDLEDFDTYLFTRSIESTGRFVRDLVVKINGNPIQQEAITKTDGSEFATEVHTESFKGWLRPWNYFKDSGVTFGYPESIEIYYQDRLVRGLTVLPQLGGYLLVDTKYINLRAPDRKDFIRDEKLEKLKEQIVAAAKPIVINILEEGEDKDIEKYENLILSTMSVSEYEKYLRYILIHSEKELDKLVSAVNNGDELTVEQVISLIEGSEEALENTPEQVDDPIVETVETYHPPVFTEEPDSITNKNAGVQRKFRKGDRLPDKTEEIVYYVDKEDLILYIDLVVEAINNKIKVVVVRNKLELEAIKKRPNMYEIGELEKKVTSQIELSNVGPQDLSEKRAMWIFSIISRVVGLESNPFVIGDLTLKRTTTLGNIKTIEETIKPFGVSDGERILVDRSKLRRANLRASEINRLLASDLIFIGSNLDTIAHELTHHMYNTDDETSAHYRLQLDLTREILTKIFNYELEEMKP